VVLLSTGTRRSHNRSNSALSEFIGGPDIDDPSRELAVVTNVVSSTDLPAGLFCNSGVQSRLQKYFASPSGRNSFIDSPSCPHKRGASRSSRTLGAGCDGRDGGALTRRRRRGRRSRVVLTPRRWRQVSGDNATGDGDKQARSPGRARRKPLKPLRGESRMDPVNLW